MKKASGLWALVLVLMFLGVSSSRKASLFPDILVNHHGDGLKMTSTSRSLKVISGYNHRHTGNVNLDDYRPIDPSPSSKASIRPGPIEHNAPLIPYIPKPSLSPPHPPSPIVSP
ncbi:PREDICTED: uncharacterized protein LOC101309210 [Fragaria vesca subsp. vesca]|uniref:uncharacterized protein LOC101309210 n=1 Tax=Fragaria vesca subsp. vesca TaxID=101020 RepID=UPI0002C2E279|nr:PREDICTED: uncharacterized protein LOC101309210 [Fragaria vesca subsp. vesca]